MAVKELHDNGHAQAEEINTAARNLMGLCSLISQLTWKLNQVEVYTRLAIYQ